MKLPPPVIAEELLTPPQPPQPPPVTDPTQGLPIPAPSPTPPALRPPAQESFQPSTTAFGDPPESHSSPVPAFASDTVEFGASSAHTPSKGVETSVSSPQPAQPSSSPDFAAPSTPVTAKRTRQDLPVFTSTSSISFGRPAGTSQSIDQAATREFKGQKDSTLQTASLDPQDPQPVLPPRSQSSVDSDRPWTPESAAETDTKAESLSSDSIWDVPDTPQIRKL